MIARTPPKLDRDEVNYKTKRLISMHICLQPRDRDYRLFRKNKRLKLGMFTLEIALTWL